MRDSKCVPKPNGPQPIDGKSLVPILKDSSRVVKDHAYHCYPRGNRMGRAIRTNRYRLVEWKAMNSKNADDSKIEYELYDYQMDPLETRNWAAAYPTIVKKLAMKLASHPVPKSRRR